jgi:hypothetical protein
MMAKKKRAAVRKKKQASKKPKPAAAAAFTPHGFRYFCAGHNCAVSPRTKHMPSGDVAVLLASGTDVWITFGANGTPFTTGGNQIHLLDGVPQTFVVDTRQSTFRYTIQCSACPDQVGIPPEMIVP